MADNLLGSRPEEVPTQEISVDTTKVTTDIEMKEQMYDSMLAGRVMAAYEEAKTSRYTTECQWIKNVQAYRSIIETGFVNQLTPGLE